MIRRHPLANSLQRGTDQRLLQLRKAHRHRRTGPQCDAHISYPTAGGGPDAGGGKAHRGHDDRDHQIASSPQFLKMADTTRSVFGDDDRGHQLVRGEHRLAVAGDEPVERQAPPAAARRQLDHRIKGEQWRHTIGRGRGIAEIAGDRAGVLDLHRSNFSCRLLQAVESRREICSNEIGPAGQPTDAPPGAAVLVSTSALDAAKFMQRADVEDRPIERPADMGGIEVGSAREHAPRLIRETIQRMLQRCRAGERHPFRASHPDPSTIGLSISSTSPAFEIGSASAPCQTSPAAPLATVPGRWPTLPFEGEWSARGHPVLRPIVNDHPTDQDDDADNLQEEKQRIDHCLPFINAAGPPNARRAGVPSFSSFSKCVNFSESTPLQVAYHYLMCSTKTHGI